MKKILFLLAFGFPAILFAQSVAINTDGSPPDNNAILDIKSISKGILMPRLTTAQRTGIVSAVPGLTVFDSETFSYWVYRGELNGDWSELLSTFDKHWERTGTTVYNNNPGNIGIGTNNPTQKLAINATNPTIDFMHAGTSKGYLQANGSDMRIGTYANNSTGNIVFTTKAVDRMWIDENGFVGVGTSAPTSAFTINGTNPWLEMKNGGVDKGYLWASNSDLKLGTNAGNATGKLIFQTKVVNRMQIDETGKMDVYGNVGIGGNTTVDGNVGIGTITPSSELTLNGNDPIMQIRNSDVDKGFVQLVGDDMKVGINSGNTYGRFFIRTQGTDRFMVNHDGRVGIGTAFPYAPLTINASIPKIDFSISDSRYAYVGVEGNNKDFVIQRENIIGKIKIINGNGWGAYLHDNGQFNYGSGANPPGYPFSSNGKILAPEFVAMAVVNWPDYVFASDYKLRPLADVKDFIRVNNHLPNIPPAAELEKNGIELADMSKRLIEKVEELTLYVIKLNENNIQLQKQVDELKKNIQK